MHTTVDLLEKQVLQSQAALAAKAKAVRLTYLDTLKAILISLVITLHTAIAYGASGSWTYVDPVKDEITSILLTLVTGTVQAFSLGLYFFISGYFTPGSYDRKGIQRFWKDRLLRLALPMILYTWALNRIPNYFAAVANGQEARSFGDFFMQTFLTHADEGPTWFIFALLMFTIGYTLWRLATPLIQPTRLAWVSRLVTPGKGIILGFGLLVTVLMFIVGLKSPVNNTWNVFGIFNLMVIFFVQYILFFIAGMLAYRNDWLTHWDGKDLRFWTWLTLGLILALPTIFGVAMATGGALESFLGGPYWQSAAFMLWVGLFSVSVSMTLILWLRDRKQPQGQIMAFAGSNSYAVYLIHPLILVPVTILFAGWALFPLLKFVIVLPLVLVLCFLTADGLRRIPGVKVVL
jgi:glucans biosynthesis protein C